MTLSVQSRREFIPINALTSTWGHETFIETANLDRLVDIGLRGFAFPFLGSASANDAQSQTLAAALLCKRSMQLINNWKRHVFSPTAPADSDAIGETVEHVVTALEALGAESVDLRDVTANRVHPEHLVATLRSTYMWRDEILGWQAAVGQASIALQKAGFNAAAVLIGLE